MPLNLALELKRIVTKVDYDKVVEDFAELVQEFCEWVESPTETAESEHYAATRFMARLYLGGLELPECEPNENFGWESGMSQEQYKRVHARFSSFPFQYYTEVFHPLAEPPEEPVIGDLHDDFADIYRDLKDGYSYWASGEQQSAVFSWRSSFGFHWGNHATSALFALHRYEAEDE